MPTATPKVIVVGAGIVGASVCYHLARRGAAVTLVDKGQPARGVTSKSFGWINVAHGPADTAQLRLRAIRDWRRLESELDYSVRIDWSGALTWNDHPNDTENFAREQAASGHDVRLIGRDAIAALEPNLKGLPECAAFAADEGAVEPSAATEALVRAAQGAGARIWLDAEVSALSSSGGKVTGIRTLEGTAEADMIVLAAGTRTGELCLHLGVEAPVDQSPSILLRFCTRHRLVNTVISNPHMEVRQASDFLMWCAEDYIDDSAENGPEAVAQRTLAQIKERLAGGATVELIDVNVGLRPIPTDGLPIIGHIPGVEGLYLAAMHAGVTLAPLVGRLVSDEIIDDMDIDLLTSCRAKRFIAS